MATEPTNNQNPSTPPEPAPVVREQTGNEKPDYDAIFQKLDSILDKRSDGIAKSALRDNGIADDEIKEIVAAYRQQKAGAAQRQTDALAALQTENEQLKAQMLESRLTAEATAQAGALGVAPETVPYLLRLADLSGAVDEKGKINKELVTEVLNKVLTDVPALKPQNTQSKGFVPIGGAGKDPQGATEDARMRGWFGLPPKK